MTSSNVGVLIREHIDLGDISLNKMNMAGSYSQLLPMLCYTDRIPLRIFIYLDS